MLFSIIIPGFNCSETIYNAISSIVDQNYLDLEIIYCDDCSEDDSVNVVKRIANKNKSIKIFQSDKNRGPGYLRNTGTKLASGRFVIYLDADDWLEMGILGKLANVINSHPSIELIEYRINIVKNNVSEEANWLNRGENGIRYTDKEDILLATGNGNKCIKKELIVNNLLENVVNNRSGEEVPFYLIVTRFVEAITDIRVKISRMARRRCAVKCKHRRAVFDIVGKCLEQPLHARLVETQVITQ